MEETEIQEIIDDTMKEFYEYEEYEDCEGKGPGFSLSFKHINSIDKIDFKELEWIHFDSNKIKNINNIDFKKLLELDLSDNEIENIDNIDFKNINWLRLDNNNIENINYENLSKLKFIALSGNPLSQSSLDVLEMLKGKGAEVYFEQKEKKEQKKSIFSKLFDKIGKNE